LARKSPEEDAMSNPVRFMSVAKLTEALDDAVYFQDNYAPDQFAQVADWLTVELDSLRIQPGKAVAKRVSK
jgi:hypothetical protein